MGFKKLSRPAPRFTAKGWAKSEFCGLTMDARAPFWCGTSIWGQCRGRTEGATPSEQEGIEST